MVYMQSSLEKLRKWLMWFVMWFVSVGGWDGTRLASLLCDLHVYSGLSQSCCRIYKLGPAWAGAEATCTACNCNMTYSNHYTTRLAPDNTLHVWVNCIVHFPNFSQAKEKYSQGAYSAAEIYKNKAKKTAWIGIVVGFVVTMIVLGVTVPVLVVVYAR